MQSDLRKLRPRDMNVLSKQDLTDIRTSFDKRWQQLHSCLHSAAYLLTPKHLEDAGAMREPELMGGFHVTVQKLVPSEDQQAVLEQLAMFRDGDGAWGSPMIR